MQQTQPTVLRFGAIFVGVILLIAAVAQWHSGTTFGLAGKGRVNRDEEPGYFLMLLVGRIVLGVGALAAGILLT